MDQSTQQNSISRRKSIISEISECVLKDRCATHGDAEDNFQDIATMWTIILKNKLHAPIAAEQVAAMMIAMKLTRIATTPEHQDHWVDAAGYAVCGGGITLKNAQALPKEATQSDSFKQMAPAYIPLPVPFER